MENPITCADIPKFHTVYTPIQLEPTPIFDGNDVIEYSNDYGLWIRLYNPVPGNLDYYYGLASNIDVSTLPINEEIIANCWLGAPTLVNGKYQTLDDTCFITKMRIIL